jgi:hypothetical protein
MLVFVPKKYMRNIIKGFFSLNVRRLIRIKADNAGTVSGVGFARVASHIFGWIAVAMPASPG